MNSLILQEDITFSLLLRLKGKGNVIIINSLCILLSCVESGMIIYRHDIPQRPRWCSACEIIMWRINYLNINLRTVARLVHVRPLVCFKLALLS